MGYKEKLNTHEWEFIRSAGIDMVDHKYPRYYKWINQFKCKHCSCRAFSSNNDDRNRKNLKVGAGGPSKFDIYVGSPVWTCEEARNNKMIEDVIT